LYRGLKKNDNSFANTVDTFCNKIPGVWHQVNYQLPKVEYPASGANEPIDTIDTEVNRTKWLEERKLLLKRSSKPVTIPATTIASISKESVEGEFPHRSGRGGTKLGRAVHSVLQTINLATGDGLEKIARAQAANEGIPECVKDVIELVKKALGSTAVKRAVASRRYYREVFVSAPLDECSIDGFIDLLFEEDDGLVIVDYKTDAIEEIPSETKNEQYSLQAGIYALATNRVTGKSIKEVVLIFLKTPKEISFKDLSNRMILAERAAKKVINY
jgi:ATP-dependent helicase/nuclease subunit A